MYNIDFSIVETGDRKVDEKAFKLIKTQFDIFQTLLRIGFSPDTRNNDELAVFVDTKKKIKEISVEAEGAFCPLCNMVQRPSATGSYNRVLPFPGAVLHLENEEYRVLLEVLKRAPKTGMFDTAEELNDMLQKFTLASKEEETKKDA